MDESDKELIRVAREDVEDDEPKKKSHKEKKRSTEGKTCQANLSHTRCSLEKKNTDFALFVVNLVVNKRAKRAAEEGRLSLTVCSYPDRPCLNRIVTLQKQISVYF